MLEINLNLNDLINIIALILVVDLQIIINYIVDIVGSMLIVRAKRIWFIGTRARHGGVVHRDIKITLGLSNRLIHDREIVLV